ncbi:helix-turn-helix domain-containing protein [Nocardia sp. NPDC049526]|uniref:helix-turn-helix domain-containing protein n=1 Tax=Nocardia sp. NPDC049526 TaxID=3364316 RepID=UPI0037BA64F7
MGQQRSLAKAFGCARVVFNDALRARREAFEAGQRISNANCRSDSPRPNARRNGSG